MHFCRPTDRKGPSFHTMDSCRQNPDGFRYFLTVFGRQESADFWSCRPMLVVQGKVLLSLLQLPLKKLKCSCLIIQLLLKILLLLYQLLLLEISLFELVPKEGIFSHNMFKQLKHRGRVPNGCCQRWFIASNAMHKEMQDEHAIIKI
ncbi:hypothetical protein GQ55_8G107300 [Panicum hallii var. hallii]|uniref:Uncharacterized protein n=1 Tax=Panicum hallii var. hallii TaxID=1504633 RepID=A0A2T7CMN1_9POAL|nr:hypothetical protein GQ55_8G107300 [Panicum hallii var. hallii]